MFNIQDPGCAWSEGWADYFPLVINKDPCFDWGIGSCGADGRDYFDLKSINRDYQPPDFPWTDMVEGRVAGSLYDLFDSDNEGYDSATFDFGPIANIVFDKEDDLNFAIFWLHWMNRVQGSQHNAVRALYQNTIDYDIEPDIDLEDKKIFENHPRWHHAIDLWDYSFDMESWNDDLTYEITYNPDAQCGISLEDDHFIDITPEHGFLGSCEATVQISDSLHENSDLFLVTVVPVVDTEYMTFVYLMAK